MTNMRPGVVALADEESAGSCSCLRIKRMELGLWEMLLCLWKLCATIYVRILEGGDRWESWLNCPILGRRWRNS